MSDLEILFDQSELKQIEESINNQINLYLNDEIDNCLETQLRKVALSQPNIFEYHQNIAGFQDLPSQLVICTFVSQLNESHSQSITSLQSQITDLKSQKVQLEELFKQCKQQRTEMQEKNQKLLIELTNFFREKVQMQHKNYHQNEIILMQKEEIYSTIQENILLKRELLEQNLQHQELLLELRLKIQGAEERNKHLIEKNAYFEKELIEIEETLREELERKQSNLITFNIEVNQLQQQYESSLQYWTKVSKIHSQNNKIVSLLHQLSTGLITYNLSQIEEFHSKVQSSKFSIDSFFNNNIENIQLLNKIIQNLKQLFQSLTLNLQNCKKDLKRQKEQNAQMEKKVIQFEKENTDLKVSNKNFEFTVTNLTQSNYKVLMELTQSKCKLEKILQDEKEKWKNIKSDLQNKLSETQNKLQKLEEKFQNKTKLQMQINSSMKTIIQKLSTSEEGGSKSEERQYLENIVQKNMQYLQQISELKLNIEESNIQIKEMTNEIIKYQEREKQCQEKQLNMKYQYQRQIIQKQQSIQKLNQEMTEIKEQINKAKQSQVEAFSQTDSQVRQSQIKRQKILNKSSLKRSIDKSHSLLSEHEGSKENKQKMLNKNSEKLKIKQTSNDLTSCKSLDCLHLQKIYALNQIINFMMNFIKGYEGNKIRNNSWFSYQIEKYGPTYEEKLNNENHLASKMKNLKFIQELCSQEVPCQKLLQQFQTIMNFYFSRWDSFSIDSSLRSTIIKQRLNKTINKQKGQQKLLEDGFYR